MSLPPGPRQPSVAQLLQWVARPLPFMHECARRYGDAFTIRFPNFPPQVVVHAPAAIRQVFTADPAVVHAGEGNAFLRPVLGANSMLLLDRAPHVRHRRLVMPPLHGERMHAYAEAMSEVTERAVASWPVGRAFVLAPHLQTVTLEVIARTVFGLAPGPRMDALCATLVRFADTGNSPLLFFPLLQRDLGPLSPWGRVARRLAQTDRAIFAEIARRRAGDGAGGEDILALLLAARDEDGRPMSDAELRDELVTLLLAGHETTATSLGWALAEILAHPAVLARLRDELQRVVGAEGALRPAHLPALEYLDATVRETLRLRPILPVVARMLKADLEVGGFALPAGTQVMPCIYLAQRRPEIYPEPERFRPERFLGAKPDPYAWLPFGGGARRCVGMAFALYEMKVVLATVLLRADLRLADAAAKRPVRRGITLAPGGGLRVVLAARRASRPESAPAGAPTESSAAPAS